MMRRAFTSRKFVTAMVGALLVGLNDSLQLGLKPETIHQIVVILASWLVGESAIDAAALWGANGKRHDRHDAAPPPPPVGAA